LTDAFESLKQSIGVSINDEVALANTRSRLRMTTLYAFANQNQMLVAGTGNKVEDYGIMFFSKFGDGGVDISPIGDLTKTEVYKVADSLGIVESIKKARPSDGLYITEKCDEDVIGATYVELEKAMEFCDMFESGEINLKHIANNISPREMEVLRIYLNRHFQNQHKMSMPPVCHVRHIIDKDF